MQGLPWHCEHFAEHFAWWTVAVLLFLLVSFVHTQRGAVQEAHHGVQRREVDMMGHMAVLNTPETFTKSDLGVCVCTLYSLMHQCAMCVLPQDMFLWGGSFLVRHDMTDRNPVTKLKRFKKAVASL